MGGEGGTSHSFCYTARISHQCLCPSVNTTQNSCLGKSSERMILCLSFRLRFMHGKTHIAPDKSTYMWNVTNKSSHVCHAELHTTLQRMSCKVTSKCIPHSSRQKLFSYVFMNLENHTTDNNIMFWNITIKDENKFLQRHLTLLRLYILSGLFYPVVSCGPCDNIHIYILLNRAHPSNNIEFVMPYTGKYFYMFVST